VGPGDTESPPGDPYDAVVLVLVVVVVVGVVVDVELVVVVVEDELVVVVDDELVVVDVEPVVDVVVVHGWVTVTVDPGCVTVTVTVFFFGFGQAPILSPRRRCAFTALRLTLMLTSFFEPVRWHITTFAFFGGFFLRTPCGPATATDAARPATNSAAMIALSFIRPP
jgi:hypothetical protein